MGDYEVRADAAKNRFYLRLSGFFRESEVAPILALVQSELEKLGPDFDTVVDISGLLPSSPAASAGLRKGAEMIKAKGRRRAVRIAGRLATTLMQFKREITGVLPDEGVTWARSLVEAERILDEWDTKSKAET